jgi:hypothetical protein
MASPGDVAVVGQIVHKEVELDETRLPVFGRNGPEALNSVGHFGRDVTMDRKDIGHHVIDEDIEVIRAQSGTRIFLQ